MRPKKRFGQNFLNNPAVLKDIRDAVAASSCRTIVEIGGGRGVLTKVLSEFSDRRLRVIEIDDDLIPGLEEIAGKDNIIRGNVLDIPLDMDDNMFVLGNIPYYITKPIIMHMIRHIDHIERSILMVQKEVGESLTSVPGRKEYNGFSVLTQIYFRVAFMRKVKRGSFFPVPGVDSALISLERRPEKPYGNMENRDLIFESFREKRKTLANNLKRIIPRDIAEKVLAECGISCDARAEEVAPETFRELLLLLKGYGV